MAPASNPPPSAKSTPEPSKRTKSSGVNQSVIASSFFGPADGNGKRACLIDNCGNTLVSNKSTKAIFSNFNTNIINWIIEDQLPSAKVKCPAFIKMIHGLDPGITIFSEHTVSGQIKALYADNLKVWLESITWKKNGLKI
ncbi:hypothetical protein PGT21_006814 [Puccinia graminis f. sp. tritici]|uniref:Uncharacterized protein n=1 Tax=Puccinia graminis f. sp. tritici TaxID=56615 RepID=A0A5B0MZX4_PUCGR|nr:hypothetical protein PGT21_006814 [Puccinia graminis f. sp. tritici]